MENRKYKLSNQPKEYALVTDFLGWHPEEFIDWMDYCYKYFLNPQEEMPKEIILISTDEKKQVTLLLDQKVTKDLFPLPFYAEERSQNWYQFYICAKKDTPDYVFIIPMC